MVIKFFTILLFCSALSAQTADQTAEQLLGDVKNISAIPDRIAAISEKLLDKPYQLEPLGEGKNGKYNQEPLYRFDVFDCETFTNTVSALALSKNLADFRTQMRELVYTNGKISFANRSHFPSADWVPDNIKRGIIKEITKEVAGKNKTAIAKGLIDRKNWFKHLGIEHIRIPNLTPTERVLKLRQLHAEAKTAKNTMTQIAYIPMTTLFKKGVPNTALFNRIPNGAIILLIHHDLNLERKMWTYLDVSHMGFVIFKSGVPYLRTASFVHQKTIDLPLIDYLATYENHPVLKGFAIFVPVQVMSPGSKSVALRESTQMTLRHSHKFASLHVGPNNPDGKFRQL